MTVTPSFRKPWMPEMYFATFAIEYEFEVVKFGASRFAHERLVTHGRSRDNPWHARLVMTGSARTIAFPSMPQANAAERALKRRVRRYWPRVDRFETPMLAGLPVHELHPQLQPSGEWLHCYPLEGDSVVRWLIDELCCEVSSVTVPSRRDDMVSRWLS